MKSRIKTKLNNIKSKATQKCPSDQTHNQQLDNRVATTFMSMHTCLRRCDRQDPIPSVHGTKVIAHWRRSAPQADGMGDLIAPRPIPVGDRSGDHTIITVHGHPPPSTQSMERELLSTPQCHCTFRKQNACGYGLALGLGHEALSHESNWTQQLYAKAACVCVRGNVDSIAICTSPGKNQYRFISCISIGANEKHLFTQVSTGALCELPRLFCCDSQSYAGFIFLPQPVRVSSLS